MGIFGSGKKIFNSSLGSKNSRAAGSRPPLEGFYLYALLGLLAYFAADLTVVAIRPSLLPTKPPPSRPKVDNQLAMKDLGSYSSVTRKNIFNADGKIPPPMTADGTQAQPGEDAEPVLTQLPIKLEGTLVHGNPSKSIATIMLQGKNQTQSFMVEDDMENMGKIVRIERRKVIFRNSSSQRLEYVEIPKDSALTFGPKAPTTGTGASVQQKSDFDFTVSRAEIEKTLSNLGAVLNQARMVPNIIPGTGGRVEGFRFVSIQPGSVYEKLGFKPMDVIKEVQGEPVNSPTKAMELYNALRTENSIKLKIDRNGRTETMTYDVTK